MGGLNNTAVHELNGFKMHPILAYLLPDVSEDDEWFVHFFVEFGA